MRRVLAGIFILIVYGSLFPWQFAARPLGPMLQWPRGLNASDVLINLALYLPLGACAYFALPWRGWRRALAPVAMSLGLSLCIELAQAFVPTRSSQLSDLLLNTAGGAIGVGLAAALRSPPTVERFLVLCWAAHLLARDFEGWAVECLGALVVASLLLPERMRRWRFAVAGACYAALVIRGLKPFVFWSGAQPFLWVPFAGFLGNQDIQMIAVLFTKVFWYGASVWAMRKLDVEWWMAGAAAAIQLGAIESIQRHMPVHVAEITDPLMALLLAGAFAAIAVKPREAAQC